MLFELSQRAILLIVVFSGLPLLVSSVLGFVVSFLQAITQIQDQTLSFGVKALGVGTTLWLLGPWATREVVEFMSESIKLIGVVGVSQSG